MDAVLPPAIALPTVKGTVTLGLTWYAASDHVTRNPYWLSANVLPAATALPTPKEIASLSDAVPDAPAATALPTRKLSCLFGPNVADSAMSPGARFRMAGVSLRAPFGGIGGSGIA
jgi:hypothetical protein